MYYIMGLFKNDKNKHNYHNINSTAIIAIFIRVFICISADNMYTRHSQVNYNTSVHLQWEKDSDNLGEF